MSDQHPDSAKFGHLLKAARLATANPLSLNEFAKKANFDKGYLSKIENRVLPVTAAVVKSYDTLLGHNGQLIADAAARGVSAHSRGPSPSPRRPATLPSLTPLVGRDEVQEKIRRVLVDSSHTSRPPVVLVSGPPAVGTSAVVRWAANEASHRFPEGVIYIDLAGYAPDGPRDPFEVLEELLLSLEVKRIGSTVAVRQQQYRTALASEPGDPRRVLIVLDNARNTEQVSDLLPGAAAVDTRVLISSYQMMPDLSVGKHWIPLSPLTVPQSVDLLKRELAKYSHPVADKPNVVAELARIAGGSPLVLMRMAGKIVHTHPDTPDRDLIAVACGRGEPDIVQARLSRLLDTISPAAKALFTNMGVWRADQAPVARHALAALAGRSPTATTPLITELQNAHLVHEVDGRRYGMTMLAARYAALLSSQGGQDETAAAHRICSWYLHSIAGASAELAPWRAESFTPPVEGIRPHHHRNAREALDWLRAERLAMVEASRVALKFDLMTECWQMLLALRGWLEVDHDFAVWRQTQRYARRAALDLRDPLAVAIVRTLAAEGLRLESRPGRTGPGVPSYDEVDKVASDAVELWRRIARNPDILPAHYVAAYSGSDAAVRAMIARGQAWALRSHAALHRDHGFAAQARHAAEAALHLLGLADHEQRALTQGLYATVLLLTKNLDMAEKRARAALDHLGHLGGAMRLEAWVHSVLAEIQVAQAEASAPERLAAARNSLRTALDLLPSTGQLSTEARLQQRLGEVLVTMQDDEAARSELLRALDLFGGLDDQPAVERVVALLTPVVQRLSAGGHPASRQDGSR